MLQIKAELPFKNPKDTLDFWDISPKRLIEKELLEGFDTFGSYYPLYLDIGSIHMDIHNSHEVLIEVLLALMKIQEGISQIKVPYFVQFDIKDPISLILTLTQTEPKKLKLKHNLGFREGGFFKNRALRKKYNHSVIVDFEEFSSQWDKLCHQFFFLLLKLYGKRNCIYDHFRFIHMLMIWDSRKTGKTKLPYNVPERKYMELFEIIERYTGRRPKDDEDLSQVLEEIINKLYEPVLTPWINLISEESLGLFMGTPVISKKEEMTTAVTQYILLTYPDTDYLVKWIGSGILKNAPKQ